MATTKYRLAEEIQRILVGSNAGAGTKFHLNEIMLSVEQVANQLLKMEYMNTNIPMGDLIPSGAAIMTYDNIPVVKYKNISKSVLPCFPLKLPKNIGVYQIIPYIVGDAGDISDVFTEFIPMELGQAFMIQKNPLVSNLSGMTGYECAGLDVYYSKDLTVDNTNAAVTMRLVVLDFTQYDEYAPLPLSPEYEFQIKTAVVQLYAAEPAEEKLPESGPNKRK